MEAYNCWHFGYHCRGYRCPFWPDTCSGRRDFGHNSGSVYSFHRRSRGWGIRNPPNTGHSGHNRRRICLEETDLGIGTRRVHLCVLLCLVSGDSRNHIRYTREARVQLSLRSMPLLIFSYLCLTYWDFGNRLRLHRKIEDPAMLC